MDILTGTFLVHLSRAVLELWVRERKKLILKIIPKLLVQKKGIFVSLHTWPEKELRGCIGYPWPVLPLWQALIDSTIAATMDPRFEPVRVDELDKIVIELSILTEPKLITTEPADYIKKIKIGRDGLIAKSEFRSGLLLPQVATEHGLDVEDFLIETCLKAGLPPTAWKEKSTKIYTFQTEIWTEKQPGGFVEKV
jgi:uncharacterized protein (TIGR00296 family)